MKTLKGSYKRLMQRRTHPGMKIAAILLMGMAVLFVIFSPVHSSPETKYIYGINPDGSCDSRYMVDINGKCQTSYSIAVRDINITRAYPRSIEYARINAANGNTDYLISIDITGKFINNSDEYGQDFQCVTSKVWIAWNKEIYENMMSPDFVKLVKQKIESGEFGSWITIKPNEYQVSKTCDFS